MKPVTSVVPQGSILGPLLLCFFNNDLPDVLLFSTTFMYADDLKILSVGNNLYNIQLNLNNVTNWVESKKMAIADDKCKQLVFLCQSQSFCLNEVIELTPAMKDLGLTIQCDMSFSLHIESRFSKANQVFFFIKRNLAVAVKSKEKIDM